MSNYDCTFDPATGMQTLRIRSSGQAATTEPEPTTPAPVPVVAELTEAQRVEIAAIQKRSLWLKRFIAAAGAISTGYSVGVILGKFMFEGSAPICPKD